MVTMKLLLTYAAGVIWSLDFPHVEVMPVI